jgi:hypothetical protein
VASRVLLDRMSRPAVLRSGLAMVVAGVAAGGLLIVTDGEGSGIFFPLLGARGGKKFMSA